MTRQEGKSAMEEMLASIREAIHEEAAHQAVGLHAPLRVKAAHEAPAMTPDNDQTRETGTPDFLKPLSEDAPETEWMDATDPDGTSASTTERNTGARSGTDGGWNDVGGAPFAPRKALLEKDLPSVGGIMGGKSPSAMDPGPQRMEETPAAAAAAETRHDGDAMFDASLEDASWWPEEETPRTEERGGAAPDARSGGPDDDESLVSPHTGELAARAFDMLRRELAPPEDLRAMTEEMLRPMLREWLDANLPEMVERLVREEIARIAHGAPSRRVR